MVASPVLGQPDGLRGFSCPQEGLDDRVFAAVVAQAARDVAAGFLDRHGDRLTGSGIARLFASVIAGDAAPPIGGDVAWGHLFRAAREPAVYRPSAVAALALWLGACGVAGDWSLPLEAAVQLRWGDYLLPAADQLSVRAGGRAELACTLGGATRRIALVRAPDGWQADGELERLASFGSPGARIQLLPARALGLDALDQPNLRDAAVFPEVSEAMRRTFQATTELVATFAPAYAPWIHRALRQVVPVEAPPRKYTSGSTGDLPGLIYVSFNTQLTQLGEALVHEATHQYFDTLYRLGPMEDGSDPRLYDSPLKAAPRPLHFILFSFHAVGNMLLYFRACRASGVVDDGYLARNEPTIAAQVVQLAQPLIDNPALTPMGRALFAPLWRRIAA